MLQIARCRIPEAVVDETGRDRLLAAGLAEFAEKGPAGARVEAISRRAGVNKQLIYYYFGDKTGLYHEVLRWCFGRAGEGAVGPEGQVHDLLVGFFPRSGRRPRVAAAAPVGGARR